jgi:hypothetical protein
MNAVAAAGAGFLLAVLWFDLMFDVQTRRHGGETLPDTVLASISAYYRRVTTEANPMGRLVGVVMLLTVLAIGAEIVQNAYPWWIAVLSLAAALSAIALALGRTMRNAVRLGRAADPPPAQTKRARAIYRDHLFCLAAMALVLGLQLAARSG